MHIDKDQLGPQHISNGTRLHRHETTQAQQSFVIYEPPRVISYTDQDILDLIGPAQTGGESGR